MRLALALRASESTVTALCAFVREKTTVLQSKVGWKALFTRIAASNEEVKRGIGFFFDEHGLSVVPQASLRLKIYF